MYTFGFAVTKTASSYLHALLFEGTGTKKVKLYNDRNLVETYPFLSVLLGIKSMTLMRALDESKYPNYSSYEVSKSEEWHRVLYN